MNKNIFIGLAWPYANGSLHLGHVSAFIGADVLARYYRLAGDHVLFASGSDCYGTPIAIAAAERGISPAEISEKYHAEFKETLINGLGFTYDIYTKTTTDQHTKVVQELFLDLYQKGFLYTKTEKALFSPYLDRFLPDRYVEGVCPKCAFDGARGDQCDNCGSLLDPLELKNPRINPKILEKNKKLTSEEAQLEVRETEHFYLKLSALQEQLTQWVEETSEPWRANARGFTKSFLAGGLHDRAVTRDTEWGVPVPLPGYETKRIYVWFEAVTGYLSASKLWAEQQGSPDAWKAFWENEAAYHYYVHGKDNIPFHTIIWPGILMAKGGLNLPNQIVSSEYLNLEGKQFSTSRNWAVWLPDFLASFNADTLRYFLIANGPETGDSNFVWAEYATVVNGELIGTFGNLVNRVLSLSAKHFPDGLSFPIELSDKQTELLKNLELAFGAIGKDIQEGKFRAALREAFAIAGQANRLIDEQAPWKKIKEEGSRAEVEADLAVFLQVIRTLAILINPFLPRTSDTINACFGFEVSTTWEYPAPLQHYKIEKVEMLFKKIEDEQIEQAKAKLGS
ncbi:MAG: methionine--tRNA ligase [Patescibacteria group bacterium]